MKIVSKFQVPISYSFRELCRQRTLRLGNALDTGKYIRHIIKEKNCIIILGDGRQRFVKQKSKYYDQIVWLCFLIIVLLHREDTGEHYRL